ERTPGQRRRAHPCALGSGFILRCVVVKVLIVGGGGREHALAWKCAASARVPAVLVAPGNAGTAAEPKVRNVAVAADDVAGLVSLAQRERVDLTIVGPEAPLVAGIVDAFGAPGLNGFVPTRAVSQRA